MEIQKGLYRSWETLDEAIDFFLNLCLELTALKRLPEPPQDLYIRVSTSGKELSDEQIDGLEVTLESL